MADNFLNFMGVFYFSAAVSRAPAGTVNIQGKKRIFILYGLDEVLDFRAHIFKAEGAIHYLEDGSGHHLRAGHDDGLPIIVYLLAESVGIEVLVELVSPFSVADSENQEKRVLLRGNGGT